MGESVPEPKELIRKGIELFKETFHASPNIAASAPGRVNLIGEHVDYNNGFVLPMVIRYHVIMLCIIVILRVVFITFPP